MARKEKIAALVKATEGIMEEIEANGTGEIYTGGEEGSAEAFYLRSLRAKNPNLANRMMASSVPVVSSVS